MSRLVHSHTQLIVRATRLVGANGVSGAVCDNLGLEPFNDRATDIFIWERTVVCRVRAAAFNLARASLLRSIIRSPFRWTTSLSDTVINGTSADSGKEIVCEITGSTPQHRIRNRNGVRNSISHRASIPA